MSLDKPGSDLLDALSAYLPEDRVAALAGGAAVPESGSGGVLFADVAGFTGLTSRLVEVFGARRGAEEVPVYLDRLFTALIGEVRAWGGSVIGFAGDAVTCWFGGDDGRRAVGCAHAMQAAMEPFADLAVAGAPVEERVALRLKVAVSCGSVRRHVVGDPSVQLLDVLAGGPVAELAELNDAAGQGQVVVSGAVAMALGLAAAGPVAPARPVAPAMPVAPEAWDALGGPNPVAAARGTPPASELGSWLLPTVQRRLEAGGGEFLTELRPVAALFLNFGGLDFEADAGAGAKLDLLVRRAQQVISEYEGNVLQLTVGDKGAYLYAAFGAPVSHEDDVQRCAAAALDLRAALLEIDLGTDLKFGLGHGTARTGAYGAATRRTYGALGEGTNMAARLMSAAPHARVYVSGAFAKALGVGFEVAPLAGLRVKGKSEPVEAFELLSRASGRRRAGADRVLVGRAAELERIAAALAQARGGRGEVLQVVAEAGMGKKALVAHALAGAEDLWPVIGACPPFGRTAPYQAWKGVFGQLLGLAEGSSAARRAAAAAAALAAIDPGLADQAGLLAPLLDLPQPTTGPVSAHDAEERSAARRAVLLTLLRHAARDAAERGRTLVLVLEDLQWLDPASDELLRALGRGVPAMPMLMITTARPHAGLSAQVPGALEGATTLRLAPLGQAEALRIVEARVAAAPQGATLPPALRLLAVERSGGNPFYLQELVADLLQRAPSSGSAADVANELPTSLHSLILGRLDRLEHEQIVSLKVASVVGQRFSTAWVSACRSVAEEAVEAALAGTGEMGLTQVVTPAPSTHEFNNAITRDVTYDSQSHATRTTLHTRLARFIEERIAGPSEPQLDLLAFHYSLGDDPDKARHYLRAAGLAAKAAYANQAAIDYFGRLLALQQGAERLATLLELGEVMTFVGAYAPAEERLAEAANRALAAGDRLRQAKAARLLGELYERQGEHGRARERLEAAAAACRELGATAELTLVLLALGGNVLWHLGAYDEAATLLAEAVALARAAGDARAAARAMHGSANIHLYRGEAAAAEADFSASLELRRAAHDEYGVANALNNLAIVAANAGRGGRAEELFAETLAMRQRLGDVPGVAVALNNLGYMAAQRGDLAAARRLYEESLARRRELGDRLGLAVSLTNLAGLVLSLGEVEEAVGLYLESVGLAVGIGNARETAAALAGLAGATAAHEEAARLALAAEFILARLGAVVDPDVRDSIERGKSRAADLAVPESLTSATLAALVEWARAGRARTAAGTDDAPSAP